MQQTENAVPYETVTVIDGTEYIVHTFFSDDARETAYDKLRRLILGNADCGNNIPTAC